ncbi:MAG: gliding motility-associated protein GldE [Bacteroidales bacterium]|nr:gliding motility-associated protein GldE [Bacteroidales bacterium]MBN2763808.1 gliding motility-associated protein GldE [Bacteroidales bacterium]
MLIYTKPFSIEVLIAILAVLFLLICSALVSGSETAYFSLTPSDMEELRNSKTKSSRTVIKLLNIPNRLLASILVLNNLINVGIVIIAAFITNSLFDFSHSPVIGFIIQVIVITALIVFSGEILPKVYANRHAMSFARFMAAPLDISEKICRPVNSILIKSTSLVNKMFVQRRKNISINELSDALELTEQNINEDKTILKGIVKFGNIDVREIMTSRVDVSGASIKSTFSKLIALIVESGYSRIPVYDNDLDNIKGILYIKDLLPHLNKTGKFRWQSLIRPPYYVPETKKISDLLREFQTNKIHMAVVIDEYGGTSGIITLEDILEEIVGEITDESDKENPFYLKVDDNTYLFEGKIALNDFFKIMNEKEDLFDDVKGEADTLAGLILELKGEIPRKNETIRCKHYNFIIKSVDTRRIKQIQVSTSQPENKNEKPA